MVTIQSHDSGMDGVPNHQCMQVLNLCVEQYRLFKSIPSTFPAAPRLNINRKGYDATSILYIDTGSMLLSTCKYVLSINKYKHLSRMGYSRVYIPGIFNYICWVYYL